MSEYQEIQEQIAELQRKAAQIRFTERAAALENIRSLMATFEISVSELGRGPEVSRRARTDTAKTHLHKVPPKYRDSAGNEWSGRGLQPRWLKAALANGTSLPSLLIP